MKKQTIAEKVATEYNGKVINGAAFFTVGDSDFVYTDGTIYASVDGRLSPGCKKAKTLKTIQKFVALRA